MGDVGLHVADFSRFQRAKPMPQLVRASVEPYEVTRRCNEDVLDSVPHVELAQQRSDDADLREKLLRVSAEQAGGITAQSRADETRQGKGQRERKRSRRTRPWLLASRFDAA